MSCILIVTALWGRSALTGTVLEYYQGLMCDHPEHEIWLECVGSEGEASKQIATRAGWGYTEAPNAPLSQKFNLVFEQAKRYSPDLVILVGSDDLISWDLIAWYIENVPKDHHNIVGLRDLYFYSIEHDETILFPGYPLPSPRTIGAGRCFSRFVLDTMNWRPWQEEILNRGLDSASTAQMRKRGILEEAHSMSSIGAAMDVKDQMVSLTPWDRVKGISGIIPIQQVVEHFECESKPGSFSGVMEKLRGLKKEFTFVPGRDYTVKITSPTHQLFGQEIRVSGETAIELVIKKVIEAP